ncbi:restriction endonuclease subunit S [Methylobacter svalbardensis]|uniref:restriction endonuclease subunit S n=1 Tax=Methylobacter svalbardensis TaxID=3080016 RepID=UPI0030EDDC8A
MNIILRLLNDLCERNIIFINPKAQPDKEFWYIDISAVDNTTKKITSPQRINGESASVRARQVVHHNDVIVSTTRPNLNAVAVVPSELNGEICSTGFCVLRCGPELDPDYLFSFVQSKMFVDSLVDFVQGALYPAVTDKQVFVQSIPWVPLNEQGQIAAKLKAQFAEVETARKALDIQERDIKKLETQLLESIFVKLKPEKFVKIGDVAVTTSGSTPSRDKKDYWTPGQYAWIKTGEVVYEPIYDTEESISEKALTECSLTLLPPKTVLVAMYGQGKTRGQSAVLEVPATTNQACFAILPNKTFHPEYLQYWLRHSYSNLRSLSDGRGGNQANLNGAMLKEFTVPLLAMEKQVRLAMTVKNMLDEIDNVKATIQTNKKEIELLSTRLLAQAFDSLSAQ